MAKKKSSPAKVQTNAGVNPMGAPAKPAAVSSIAAAGPVLSKREARSIADAKGKTVAQVMANAQTQGVEPGLPLPVVITAFADKSFTFIIKTPPAATLIKKSIKIDKASTKPGLEKVGKITRAQLEEIAKTKMKDLTAADLDAAVRTIAGTARSMGVNVEGV